MALRINHNIAALNALRNLNKTDDELSSSLERLSSGQKINRAADGPAALVISEQMRGQIASVNQAIQNSEASISMVQTAEAALNEVNNLLVSMRQLSIHAANEGANDRRMLQADQAEIDNGLDTIDRIARTSQFGTRTLLDGSNGANGVAVGEGLEFVSASPQTKSSPAEGYAVNITRAATRAEARGQRAIELADLEGPDAKDFKIMVEEGGKSIAFSLDNSESGRTVRNMVANLRENPGQFNADQVLQNIREIIADDLERKAQQDGLKVDVFVDHSQAGPGSGGGVLVVRHKEFGSRPTFFVSSSAAGVLSQQTGKFEEAVHGRDVEGTIAGKIGLGRGEVLQGGEGTDVDGLLVRYHGVRELKVRLPKEVESGGVLVPNPALTDIRTMAPPQPGALPLGSHEEGDSVVYTWEVPQDVSQPVEGYVHVTQNSLSFQVGPTRGQQVRISLLDAKTDRLATGVKNASGFRSLREINVTTAQGAEDALLLIDDSINAISSVRANLGAFQKNTLQSNTNALRIAHENLTSAESNLRDADMAQEMSQFTRNQIMMQAGTAMLAQANQTPNVVLQLLNNRAA
ncbi:MAG TPA: flagellin [bacterium]|nr:flagellin [bacterium]